jgi:hypothetical protein
MMCNYITPDEYARAEQNGIHRRTLEYRIKAGWDRERAITQPTERAVHPMMATAKANGISRKAFYQRIKAGWPLEKAATKPSQRKGGRKHAKT